MQEKFYPNPNEILNQARKIVKNKKEETNTKENQEIIKDAKKHMKIVLLQNMK